MTTYDKIVLHKDMGYDLLIPNKDGYVIESVTVNLEQYSKIGEFEDGLAIVQKDGKLGLINEEYKELTLAKGVGQKLAQKIILELRDKLIKANIAVVSDKFNNIELSPASQETTSILLSLGYTEEEINTAYKVVLNKCENRDDSEELLRETLKYLSM